LPGKKDKVARLSALVMHQGAIVIPKFIGVADRPLDAILSQVVGYNEPGFLEHEPDESRTVKALGRRLT
jgi:hypothetical protein